MKSTNTMSDPRSVKYVHQLPYREERELCSILDLNNQWEELGGNYMKFSVLELYDIKRVEKCGESPTRRLLQIWGQRNNTVLKLYEILYQMEHFQAMTVLEPFVPEKYHVLEQDTEITRAMRQLEQASIRTDSGQGMREAVASRPIATQEEESFRTSMSNTNLNHNLDDETKKALSAKEGIRQIPNKIPQSLLDPSHSLKKDKGLLQKKILNQTVPASSVSMKTAESCEENNCRGCSKKHVNLEMQFLAEYNQKAMKEYPNMKANDSKSSQEVPSLVKSNQPRSGTTIGTGGIFNATKSSAKSDMSVLSDCSVPMIAYKELQDATDNFDEKNLLGKGGFGSVYKGTWKLSKVAVKKIYLETDVAAMNTMSVEISQTFDELRYLQSFRHKNILQVFGFSADPGKPPCLVYELMENGSLEERLQCRRRSVNDKVTTIKCDPLSWRIRLKIAQGTASALQYLHTVKSTPIIHGDVKSANILLEKELEPKLGDFGLAREGPQSDYTSVKVTRVNGTRAYIPTEYLRDRKLSTKVDTYSFGIVLLEICTGLRAYDGKRKFPFMKNYIDEITDMKSLIDTKAGSEYQEVFDSLSAIALQCTNDKPKNRPDMVNVYKKLEQVCNYLVGEQARKESEQQKVIPPYMSPTYMYSPGYPSLPNNGFGMPSFNSYQPGFYPYVYSVQSQPNRMAAPSLPQRTPTSQQKTQSSSPSIIEEESSVTQPAATDDDLNNSNNSQYLPNLTEIGKKRSFLD